jgi:hypothetical protein
MRTAIFVVVTCLVLFLCGYMVAQKLHDVFSYRVSALACRY